MASDFDSSSSGIDNSIPDGLRVPRQASLTSYSAHAIGIPSGHSDDVAVHGGGRPKSFVRSFVDENVCGRFFSNAAPPKKAARNATQVKRNLTT